mmetsp:Transcript_64128/g.202887  ORF Transcript_64128/g.202887 Transcript_64128/m.202887 type:complete len:164 (-) Transcript_64128:113-604(-)|eukprot:CAMPEP_0182905838 /NCGR_PEP_ID=MMETSP0034_2-20130328/33258_1 /TAXON_ID=156128 /ORGANISM="Nephroselmis pyriformis, Strain CCMP717" /LENGTH=163 /DNA_ID=CAMNT_0025041347 /DNA_START=109 /DNA_END=600 /DNA_ORIENTATION=+
MSMGQPEWGLQAVSKNTPFVAALMSFAIAQFAKVFTTWYATRQWDFRRLVGSGGMPSSHAAFVCGLTVSIGMMEGMQATSFAISLVLSLIVMYDASGVRLHAGRQAEVLNQIIFELPPEHPVSDTRQLREHIGHTPLQVGMGAVVGTVVAYLFTFQGMVSGPR